MKLRPYHNPENVDESKVPDGWRFMYADEAGSTTEVECRIWGDCCFGNFTYIGGTCLRFTYIVPVA